MIPWKEEPEAESEMIKQALWDIRRVLRYLGHSAENYGYFADDPHLLAARACAERADKRMSKLYQPEDAAP